VTAAGVPGVLADPVGAAVTLITRADPGLGREAARQAVTEVARGRAVRRKLAQALADRPGILADGRSPAPKVAGDLLLALRKAGATTISPPACAGCGKHLRTLSRLGQDWYCGGCARRDGQCSACGREAPITGLDRKGQPRCARCPDRDDRDPLAVLTAAVTVADPSLTADAVAAAALRVFSKPSNLRKLAWAVEDNPGLLTGDGTRAPVMGILRLIDELAGAGAEGIARPACGRCRRVVQLYRRIGGLWCCRNCVAKTRTQPCARCGTMKEPAARDERGQPICPNCLVSDPANLEECARCGRKRRVGTRTPDGPVCLSCRPWPVLICSICGREAPCAISKATGKPWCRACKQRWARCAQCGTVAPVRGGTAGAPLCSACTVPGAEFWRTCPGCGQEGRILLGQCRTCRLREQLRDLLAGPEGTISPALQALHDNLAGSERPATALHWLGKSTAAILRELATGQRPLTHAALDELPDSKPLRHLRTILVATGTLPERDEHMTRLETRIAQAIAEQPGPGERRLLHQYATWHVVRRLRGRLAGKHATHGQFVSAQRNVRAAIALLDWLAARGLALDTAWQGHLDAWLGDPQAAHRADAGNFVRWARKNKLTTLDFAAVRWGGPSGEIDTETRWEQARWLLHDDSLKPEDRLAGLLILLYAQKTSVISRLTLSHVQAAGGQVLIRLGREPVMLPGPLGALALQVAATRRGHAALGDDGTSAWLFPGGQPGRPISAFRLGERLHQLGIRCGQSRSAALFQLATDLPAAVLASMLGIHISVAVHWQRISAGDWMAYAAEVSRRPSRQPVPSRHETPGKA
jgi:hypothetical protein